MTQPFQEFLRQHPGHWAFKTYSIAEKQKLLFPPILILMGEAIYSLEWLNLAKKITDNWTRTHDLLIPDVVSKASTLLIKGAQNITVSSRVGSADHRWRNVSRSCDGELKEQKVPFQRLRPDDSPVLFCP